MDEIDLARIRRSYEKNELREDTVSRDPFAQLQHWLQDAHDACSLEANAMCVCTAADKRPSARMVLLRGLDERGLVFFTELFQPQRPRACIQRIRGGAVLLGRAERQVRVEGCAEQLPEEESDAYFATRPAGHQIGAWASEQSDPIEDRELLERRVHDYGERFAGEQIPRPHSWGGYVIRPDRFEFWQGRPNRLHDRLAFVRDGPSWNVQRLQP